MPRQPCIPDDLPIETLDWRRLVPLIAQANHEVGRYNGALVGLVNPDVLLTPIMIQEAVLSSKIEGTQATLSEVLQHQAGEQFSEEKNRDIQEIINYRKALKVGIDYLQQDRSLSLSFIRELHQILMDSVRGKNKEPGKFREDQNWIGIKERPIEEARFVPPAPLVMQDFLQKLERFIAEPYDDTLIQMAFIHAQFEIIHPFKDGNGRLGRMLIPLFFYQKRVLPRPVFYLSEYLEQHDEEYRDRLLAITEVGDWQGWVEFFLRAIIRQSQMNLQKAEAIYRLYERMKIAFQKLTRSQYAVVALDAFFTMPTLSASDFTKLSGIGKASAANILTTLRQYNVIHCLSESSGRRAAIYTMPELINACEGREVFKPIMSS